jgi:type IV pilus assembly protein PilA
MPRDSHFPSNAAAARERTTRTPRRIGGGFSLLELMIVIAIIVTLALMALPGVPDKLVRDRIAEAIKLADIVKPPIATAWSTTGRLPVDNAAAGLPVAENIVSDMISSVAVESGAIQITFGNKANAAINGKMLSLRPGVVEDARIVPISWVCGNSEPPARMMVRGLNKTTVAERYLPLACRASRAPAAP